MEYILYYFTFFVLIIGTVLYLTRGYWTPMLPNMFTDTLSSSGSFIYSRLPAIPSRHGRGSPSGSFTADMEAGLSSSTFSLSGNVSSGDSRAGLDDGAKREILRIMKSRRMQFDDARRVYMEQRFSANGIGPDGRPKDPKFVSFS